jgi:hypothetical protein
MRQEVWGQGLLCASSMQMNSQWVLSVPLDLSGHHLQPQGTSAISEWLTPNYKGRLQGHILLDI